jgi:branched-chain amino acid aminotransferase
MKWIIVNGKLQNSEEPVLFADDRGFRYGDGLFETMKMVNGNIPLIQLHFDRLFSGLQLLQFKVPALFTSTNLIKEISALCNKNGYTTARIRLSVSRGKGGLYDENSDLNYVIECWEIDPMANSFNENGLAVGVFENAKKSCDAFSNLKSANFLIYSMAAIFAKANKFNDCLILNVHDRISDSTIANVFWVKDLEIYTTPLTEGCVDGVLRKYLLNESSKHGVIVKQKGVDISELEEADEIFLTNAVKGIRWVKSFQDKKLTNRFSSEIYQRFIKTILH